MSWDINYEAGLKRGKYMGSATISSNETVALAIPVVALVRNATDIVTAYEGQNDSPSTTQKGLTFGPDGIARTFVFIPKRFRVVYGSLTITSGSANVLDPFLDIGADGSKEWTFSGRFDIGVVVDNIEDGFNSYLSKNASSSDGWNVPMIIHGTPGESVTVSGMQVYLDTNGMVQFNATNYTAGEGDGKAIVTVTRTGDIASAATVEYATSNGTAKEGKDYVAAQGILSFAAGETTRTFPVLVIDNAFVDGSRTVNVNLNSTSGAGLSTQSTAVITISDNDTTSTTASRLRWSRRLSRPVNTDSDSDRDRQPFIARIINGLGPKFLRPPDSEELLTKNL